MTALQETFHPKTIIKGFSAALLAVAMMIAVAPVAGAISMTSVSPASGATIELSDDQTLVLTMTAATEAGETLRELEVDHSFGGDPAFPEFSVYADEADPYNNVDGTETGQEALFASFGVSVTYSASLQQWSIDFGPSVTQQIIDNGGDVTFYFVLYGVDADNNPISWGSMSPTTPENTFAYTLALAEATDEEDETAPGVPNTATAEGSAPSAALFVGAGAVILAGAVAVARRYARS